MNSDQAPQGRKIYRRTFLGIAILVGLCFAGIKLIEHNKPQAQRQPIVPHSIQVKTQIIVLKEHPLKVEAMGELKAFRSIELKPEVTGLIIEEHPKLELGVTIEKGEVLYQIDTRDAQTLVQKAKAELVNAKLKLKEEQGRQALALQEWNSLGLEHKNSLEKELSLREPHLIKAQADAQFAEANLASAELNLERCQVKAPFKSIVTAVFAHQGSKVSPQDRLIQLMDNSRLDFHLHLRQDQLRWIPDQQKLEVHLELSNNKTLIGVLKHIMPELSQPGRMATAIVEVSATDSSLSKELLASRFLKAHFYSVAQAQAVITPRHAIHGPNSVWIYQADGTLAFQTVTWEPYGPDQALVLAGLSHGQKLIVSDLSAPVEGMKCEERTESSHE